MNEKTVEELMERRNAIAAEIDLPEADLDALEAELRDINAELERRKAEEAKRKEIRAAVAQTEGKKITEKEKKHMTINEIRSLPEYVEAYAKYIKTEDDKECRKILTENAAADNVAVTDGILPIPTVVEGFIRTSWEKNELLRRVRKTYIRGNLKVGFELAATPAVVHAEGATKPDEEQLALGTVTIIPESIKKWITVTDEAMDMGGEEFLRYIVDEITNKIAKKAQQELLGLVSSAPATPSPTEVSVNVIESDGSDLLSIVAQAMAVLSSEADDPVIVMNRATWGAFKAAQASANYAYDPFEGLPIVFDNSMPTLDDENAKWLIVGDFGRGALANFPNGEEIRVKRDDLSLAEYDLVKFVGREYIGLGLVADKMFTVVTNESHA